MNSNETPKPTPVDTIVILHRYLCERCGGTGIQPSGCWTGKAYDSQTGTCDTCNGDGYLGTPVRVVSQLEP